MHNSIIEKLKENSETYFDFCFTKDGSVGLYNRDVDDIYHSVFGAKSEAWEKFVTPLNFEKNFMHKKTLKVLDICYGIGYNTKALLKKLIQSGYKGAAQIDILEYDESLVLLSPFVKDGFFKNEPGISFILLKNLWPYIQNTYYKKKVGDILSDSKNKKFLEPFYRNFIKKYLFHWYIYNPLTKLLAFLHNIYYHCISERIKKPLNASKINKFVIRPYFDDARSTIKGLSSGYDIVFLDAFTPAKLPTLWSLEFFKELYRLTCDDCMVVTYSNSAAVKHAMVEAGFCVGKLYDKKNRACGTVASKNPNYIKNKLDEYDIGLMKTNAGIYYLDEGLNSTAEEILQEHSERKQKLNLESSSHYIKSFKQNKESKVHA